VKEVPKWLTEQPQPDQLGNVIGMGTPLTADAYMVASLQTALLDRSLEDQLLNAAMGLSGESGELMDHIKKWQYHGHSLDQEYVLKEIGDVLWYVALACWAIQAPMSRVMEENIKKLSARYGSKFSEERSRNREA
jgi:NTP pyrophosphatase (non-canonical NTP hydrolase)